MEQYETYATADSVQDFYYSASVSVNGGEGLEPVSNEAEEDDEDEDEDTSSDSSSDSGFGSFGGFGGGMQFPGGNFGAIRGADSDFSVVGYSGEA